MTGAFIVGHAVGSAGGGPPGVASQALVPAVLGQLLTTSQVRTTDVHDIAVAADDTSADGAVARCLADLNWPGRPTFGFFARGLASSLNALSHAALGARTEHSDLSMVLAVGASVDTGRRDPLFTAALLVASENYVMRSRCAIQARIGRVVNAAHTSRRTVDALYEAAVRLLMNETMNSVEVDEWRVWLPVPAQLADLVDRLGVDSGTVTECSAGWPDTLTTPPASLCAVVSNCAAEPAAAPRTAVTIFPGLGGGAVAVMLHRAPAPSSAEGKTP